MATNFLSANVYYKPPAKHSAAPATRQLRRIDAETNISDGV